MSPLIRQLLADVKKFNQPERERTLFSLGGRGYFENPASDMLAFFLKPEAEHGFRSLFLQTFLECLNIDAIEEINLSNVTVSREDQTKEGKRIDLVIQSPGWVLLIENKIYHGQNNPFPSYEAHGRQLAGDRTLIMTILSPSGTSVDPRWSPVSYKDYCVALRRALTFSLFDQPYSKWLIFAREFILHFENELYQPTTIMSPEEAESITKVKKLSSDYRLFMHELLGQRLSEAIPDQEFRTKDDGWAIRCHSDDWGQSNIAFCSPVASAAGKKFYLTVYLVGLDEEQEAKAHILFEGMRYWPEGKWRAWQTQSQLDSREAAIAELCRLGAIVSALLPPIPPSQEPANLFTAQETAAAHDS
jgi:hypothetical protein